MSSHPAHLHSIMTLINPFNRQLYPTAKHQSMRYTPYLFASGKITNVQNDEASFNLSSYPWTTAHHMPTPVPIYSIFDKSCPRFQTKAPMPSIDRFVATSGFLCFVNRTSPEEESDSENEENRSETASNHDSVGPTVRSL
jgi:hypothetical protein